jgi:hypothetical protein
MPGVRRVGMNLPIKRNEKWVQCQRSYIDGEIRESEVGGRSNRGEETRKTDVP